MFYVPYLAGASALLLVAAVLAAFFLIRYAMRVKERSRELHNAQQRMIADFAHNLQTPLAVLRNKVERLEQNLLHDGQAASLSQTVDSLTRFVQDLLAFTSLEEGFAKRKELFSLTGLLCEVYEETADIAEAENILLALDAPLEVSIYGSRVHMRDAVMNLVCNAIKYMGSSSIRRIRMSLRIRSSQALVEITDTGMGIPEGDLPRIFERFYRGSNRIYGSVQGTGLGLAIVERVIQEHGGAITVTSEVGKGSTFTLVLPAGAQERSHTLSQ